MAKTNTKGKKLKNPFAGYQGKRKEESVVKVQAAIQTIMQFKGKISYSAVAKLAKMTISGIKRNKECVMLIEQTKAHQNGSNLPLINSMNFMPKTIDDAISIIRLQRVEIRELRNKLSIYEKAMKRYNLVKSVNGEYIIEPAEVKANNITDALKRVIQAILDDKVYTLTPEGIKDALNNVVINKYLLTAAGLLESHEEGI